ncbi:hypothetical protein ACFV1L_13135 [Kitasatospora sp. NPDC059646]|uniref:hypothetical protein n=1 Tax=Kitasatospora sp. NPDC059646 TaxID=3346893 RepID=UPI0036C9B872
MRRGAPAGTTAWPVLGHLSSTAEPFRRRPGRSAARAAERAARGSQEQLHWADKRREESRWNWTTAFTDGAWTWVPSDTGDAATERQLAELLPHCHDWTPMRLHVESGPTGTTTVHTLFGHLENWDPRRGVLRSGPSTATAPWPWHSTGSPG